MFKKPHVVSCSFVTMMKTKELSEDIRSAIISKHKISKEHKAISKNLSISVSVCNDIKKLAKHGTVSNLPRRAWKRKIDLRSQGGLCELWKNTSYNIQRPASWPGTIRGNGFNMYNTKRAKLTRALRLRKTPLLKKETAKRKDWSLPKSIWTNHNPSGKVFCGQNKEK